MNFKELKEKYGYEILCKYKLDIPYADEEEVYLNDKNTKDAKITVESKEEIAVTSVIFSGVLTMPLHKIKEVKILWIGEHIGSFVPTGHYEVDDVFIWTFGINRFKLTVCTRFKNYVAGVGKKMWAK